MRTPEHAIVVRPLRFTDRFAQMRGFYESLGLRPRVESRRGGWVDLCGARGMMALHEAATSDSGGLPGQTRLSFEATDVTGLRDRLHEAGFTSATVWDEAYGRVLSVTDPAGDRMWVDERSDDDYGYRRHSQPVSPRIVPTPVCRVIEAATYSDFLALFGLAPSGSPTRPAMLSGPGGTVLLQRAEQASEAVGAGSRFETAEPLDELLLRLRDRGHADAQLRDDALWVTDPDGCRTSIHPTPSLP